MGVQTWAEATTFALQNLWNGFLAFIPDLIGAIIVFIVGWFVAQGVGRLVAEILIRLKINKFFEKTGWVASLEKAEVKVNPSEFIGAIIKWILVIVFLLASVEILGLEEFTGFLRSILSYLPNVIVAALILVVTVILVDVVEKVVRTSIEKMKIGYSKGITVLIKWSIWIFAVLAILHQLGVARPFMETLFTGFVAMMVLTVGISFGLGGKEVAAEILQDLKKKLKE